MAKRVGMRRARCASKPAAPAVLLARSVEGKVAHGGTHAQTHNRIGKS